MSERLSGHGAAFAIGLLAGSIATLLLATQSKKKQNDTSRASSISDAPSQTQQTNNYNDDGGGALSQFLPPEIRNEMLSRNALYFGDDGMDKITNASVLVIGLGGVGSHTAHMLARAGVQYLRLVDFDQVTLSSLNRHAVATLKDVGLPKVTVLCNYLRQICPDTTKLMLDPVVKMFTGEGEKDGTMMDPPEGREWDIVIGELSFLNVLN